MKIHKTLFLATAVLLLPVTSAFPVIQDMQAIAENMNTGSIVSSESLSGSVSKPSQLSIMPDSTLHESTQAIIDFLSATITSAPITTGSGGQMEVLNKELEAYLQDQLMSSSQTPFWKRKSILLFGGLLILGGLFTALLSGGGSGSGSSSGNGSGGGSSNPGDLFGVDEGGGGGSGDGGSGDGGGLGGGGDNDGGSDGDGDVPSNPEPSSIMLLGSGLLAALYARKRRLIS
ncbi:MAG: PEP-CTERM sorting domain-containing protein [Candidatus Omnitrophica bacterium]|nr:PEP-CTERM sorting domain-containing protein [Candidatus Omnitrophota bacterium]